ncbi:MAG: glycoside hydrolase family 30 beta sandwich domain-containing protein [Ferruginibacter sp.]
MSSVHAAYPNKNLYFTEQYTASTGSFSGDFMWHLKNVMIGAMVNWSKNALEWNLANDINFNPHTPGGCNTCKGGLTIDGTNVIRNVGYYIVAQISKFVPAGSVHIASSTTGSLSNVAFKTPAGKNVVLVLNDGASPQTIILKTATRSIPSYLPANTVGTYVW